MSFLLDPVGFVADSIAICNALGLHTPAQTSQTAALKQSILSAITTSQDELESAIETCTYHLEKLITTSSVIEIRSRCETPCALDNRRLELLIKFLLHIKTFAPHNVFAVFVRYRVGTNVATLGFAGTSDDQIEHLVGRVDDFVRVLQVMPAPMTCYVTTRTRSKFDVSIESLCVAYLVLLATNVCMQSRVVIAESMTDSKLTADGHKTVALLSGKSPRTGCAEYDELRRVFLVGDTRTGKSSLGNALLRAPFFTPSKGMTGTMNIDRGDRVEQIDGEIWKTEFYDTPGLNDKDGMDVLYQTAIEDKIREKQNASALIMTVSVDGGISQAMERSVKEYKALFGESIASMLLIVLTVNHEANSRELGLLKQMNFPSLSKMDKHILLGNVFCVSLHDLRSRNFSDSHAVVEEIAARVRHMPMKFIESLKSDYKKIREAVRQQANDANQMIQKMVNDGWRSFDSLAEEYDSCQYVKMTNMMIDGFIMKHMALEQFDSLVRKGATGLVKNAVFMVGSFGIIPAVRKTAIHVHCSGPRAEALWSRFFAGNKSSCDDSSLLLKFGDLIYDEGLAVTVHDGGKSLIGTLRLKVHNITIFDPTCKTHNELLPKIQDFLQEFSNRSQQLADDVIQQIVRANLPAAVKTAQKRKKYDERKRDGQKVVTKMFHSIIGRDLPGASQTNG